MKMTIYYRKAPAPTLLDLVITPRDEAILTPDHAASSYGQPVVVVDGQALGPAEFPHVFQVPGASQEIADMIRAARSAGYNAISASE